MTSEILLDVLDALKRRGLSEAEVFHKRGRSRTLRLEGSVPITSLRQEEGWAVRAGNHDGSFFYTASGSPRPDAPWPEPTGRALRLPSARPIPTWAPPMDLDAPLLGENEAVHLLNGVSRALTDELPGARLVRAYLEDGAGDQELASSREIEARSRLRAASLFLEARGPNRDDPSISVLLAEREARRFLPKTVARHLADRLLLSTRGAPRNRDRGDLLLSHGVVAPLLAALSPLWIGPRAPSVVRDLCDQGRLAARGFTLVDDGRHPRGILQAPVDGEGLPTRRVVLVEEGMYRQPLVSWRQATPRMQASGCSRRFGWRDLPDPGPTHLYLESASTTGVGELLSSLSRGYYLLSTHGSVKVEAGFSRFAVPVSGFAIEGGRPTGSISGTWLVGTVSAFLKGLVAAARDLTFTPLGGGMIGAPTLLVKGLELRHRL